MTFLWTTFRKQPINQKVEKKHYLQHPTARTVRDTLSPEAKQPNLASIPFDRASFNVKHDTILDRFLHGI